ncbi:MAG: tyrosine-type recombinase/integrase [Clostridia bacterium]|nr:tyrosine-type recombinase/integrase [Clostridia bacterium]
MNDIDYINELFNEFLRNRLKTDKARKAYRRELNKFSNFIGKDYFDATFEDCNLFINHLKNKAKKKHLSLATVERIYSTLFSVFNFLEEHLACICNHFKQIEKPHVSRNVSPEKIISWNEVDKILFVLKKGNIRDYAIFLLIFTSGLTSNELVNLKWSQFIKDESENLGIIFKEKNGNRYVKVHPDTWELLLKYRNVLGLVSDDSYVFLNNRGNKISSRRVRGIFKEVCEKAGLERNYTPRDLRHSLAAITLKKGATASLVKEQLGWSNSRIAEWYLYTIQQLEENAIDYLNFKLK